MAEVLDDTTCVLTKFADEIRDISGRVVSLGDVQRWMRAVIAQGHSGMFHAPIWEKHDGRNVAIVGPLSSVD